MSILPKNEKNKFYLIRLVYKCKTNPYSDCIFCNGKKKIIVKSIKADCLYCESSGKREIVESVDFNYDIVSFICKYKVEIKDNKIEKFNTCNYSIFFSHTNCDIFGFNEAAIGKSIFPSIDEARARVDYLLQKDIITSEKMLRIFNTNPHSHSTDTFSCHPYILQVKDMTNVPTTKSNSKYARRKPMPLVALNNFYADKIHRTPTVFYPHNVTNLHDRCSDNNKENELTIEEKIYPKTYIKNLKKGTLK